MSVGQYIVLALTVATSLVNHVIPTAGNEIICANCTNHKSLTDAINKFAIDLYKEINKKYAESNVFLSPVSVSTALAMLLLGAEGVTKTEMETVLNVKNIPELHSTYLCLNKILYVKTNGMELRSANKLYPDYTLDVKQAFMEAIKKYYGGSIQELDYKDSTHATNTINNWVANQTNQLIKEVLQPGDIDANTVFSLVNAIYFKGEWLTKFNPCDTTVQPFYVNATKTVDVDMMYQEAPFRYYHNIELGAQFLDLPYLGDKFSMILVVPDEHDGINDVSKRITNKKIEAVMGYLKSPISGRDVYVSLPKMKFKWREELSSVLDAMGMKQLFSARVNLDLFSEDPRLDVSKVIHEAFVDVNEQGTEAAAVTVIAGGRSGYVPPPVKVNCNHPFMFLIYDKECGVILFIGKVMNPPAASSSVPTVKNERDMDICRQTCREQCYGKLLKPKMGRSGNGVPEKITTNKCQECRKFIKTCKKGRKYPEADPYAKLFKNDFQFLRECKETCDCKQKLGGKTGKPANCSET